MNWMMFAVVLMGCTPEVGFTPLEGPAFDADSGAFTGEGDEMLIGLTHLQVINAPGPGGKFGDHAQAVGEHLFTAEPEGFLGAAFRNRGQLQQWTMSVWQDEESLAAFVVSEPHISAMRDFGSVTTGGRTRVMPITADELPMSWDRAMELLAEESGFNVGETTWPEES